jgi:hypothetical protein
MLVGYLFIRQSFSGFGAANVEIISNPQKKKYNNNNNKNKKIK